MPDYTHKIALGSAQFGMDYGVVNEGGQVSAEHIAQILAYAAEKNPQMIIDTAPLYGNSEEVLGRALAQMSSHDFRIITKTDANFDALEETFTRSRRHLGQETLYGLLDHNAWHLLSSENRDKTYRLMQSFKDKGWVGKIGATIYTRADIETLLENYDLDILQIPINIFDQRLLEDNFLSDLKSQGIEIHARSVFLQGILLCETAALPTFFETYKAHFTAFDDFCKSHEISKAQACINFVQSLEAIDMLVLGVLSKEQLDEHILNSNPLAVPDFSSLACFDEPLINPSLWPKNR
ncbi:MAG: aldo/keto reductase [Alphaproteobacteria bacterium]|nr:aldo/keto reductase [Alphaproteobacteria bacterium]